VYCHHRPLERVPGVARKYDGAVARMRAHGFEGEEIAFDTKEASPSAYLTDPDGNVVELWTWDVAHHLDRRGRLSFDRRTAPKHGPALKRTAWGMRGMACARIGPSALRRPQSLGYALASVDVNESPAGYSAHPTAVVEDGALVGPGTRIWHHSHIRRGSQIGAECNLGFSVYVDAGAVIGDRCKIQNHVSVYRGVVLEDDVFVGPSATFTNDLSPRAASPEWEVVITRVGSGASIGANATVVCGVTIGAWAMVGAGSVVTSEVPEYGLVVGTPARLIGWVCNCGALLARVAEPIPPKCGNCARPTEGIGAS
jgi:acetyltransferase-like isoleucine patch superfamily enzyme